MDDCGDCDSLRITLDILQSSDIVTANEHYIQDFEVCRLLGKSRYWCVVGSNNWLRVDVNNPACIDVHWKLDGVSSTL